MTDVIEQLEKTPVSREAVVTIYNEDGEALEMSDAQAREVFRELRKLYGRQK